MSLDDGFDDDECPFRKEEDDCMHVFVIEDAKLKKEKNSKKKSVVLTVSSKDITIPNSKRKVKLLKKIPTGNFKNVRFDIDHEGVCNAFVV